jgi:hypothetical protein
MTTSLVVGRLRVRHGVQDHDPPTIAVFKPRSFLRRRDPGILLSLIDLLTDTPGDDALLGLLMNAVQRAYDVVGGSTTRRLRAAVQAANLQIVEWNAAHPDGRQAAGITCAALVGDGLYVAQAGPALAWVAHPGFLDRFPADSPWLSEEPLDSMPRGLWAPLGARDDTYVSLGFVEIGPGFTLSLTSAHLLQIVTEDEVAQLLDQDPDDVVRDLAAIAAGTHLSALVVTLVVEEAETMLPATEPTGRATGPTFRQSAAAATGRAVSGLGAASSALLRGVANVLEALLPEPTTGQGSTDSVSSARRRQALMWLAALIPVALVLLTAAMYWRRDVDTVVQYQILTASAADRLQQAEAVMETDPEGARELLEAAAAEAERALRLRPDDPSAVQLRADAAQGLDLLDSVARLTDIVAVASLPGGADDRRRLVVQGTSAYVLDTSAQTVYRVGLGDRRIVETLKAETEHAGRRVGRLVDMAWVPPGGVRDQAAIVILDATGTAWQINAVGDVEPLRVAGTADWQQPGVIGGFAGNLYVADLSQGQILKYSPTVDGYAVPAVEWLAPTVDVSLSDAVDMSIDGSIYVLGEDGRVHKFVGGEPAPFAQADAFSLRRPVACFARPPGTAVYLVGATQLLQLDSSGAFVRQLLPPERPWDRLSAVWVDEPNNRLYAIDGGTLLMGQLP